MANASNYLENAIINHVLGGPDFTRPATVYIGLWTATLDDTSTGSTAGEVSGGSYVRLAIANNTTNWPNASAGVKSNGVDFTFATPTAGWGTVTHVAILDASSAGNILFWIALTTSKTINSGDTVKFNATTLTITVN